MKKTTSTSKLFAVLLALCTLLSAVSLTATAAGVNYMPRVSVSYDYINYQAGDAPRATAAVTEGDCTVAYEYWRELEQKEAGGVWSGTGRYWYSDPDKMASLAEDKRITQFEAGHHYGYNIVLTANRGAFFGGTETVVSLGDHEWGVPDRNTNLEIKQTSTRLNIYGIYAIDLPDDSTDQVITGVSIIGVNCDLDASAPISFTAEAGSDSVGKFDIIEESWEAGGSANDIIKSTDATSRAPIPGIEYWYSIVLRAKDGYVFSQDFSDSRHCIKENSGVTFTLGGNMYEGRFAVSDDGKTLTAWEFMDPVRAAGSTEPSYRIIEGANGAWTQNTDGTLTFRATGDFSKFTEVKVDGTTLSTDRYTAVSGSTVVTLNADYLASLSVGAHTLTVVYNDGECSTSFEVRAAQTEGGDTSPSTVPDTTPSVGQSDTPDTADGTPQTDDGSHYVLWIALFVVGVASLTAAVVIGKRRKYSVK